MRTSKRTRHLIRTHTKQIRKARVVVIFYFSTTAKEVNDLLWAAFDTNKTISFTTLCACALVWMYARVRSTFENRKETYTFVLERTNGTRVRPCTLEYAVYVLTVRRPAALERPVVRRLRFRNGNAWLSRFRDDISSPFRSYVRRRRIRFLSARKKTAKQPAAVFYRLVYPPDLGDCSRHELSDVLSRTTSTVSTTAIGLRVSNIRNHPVFSTREIGKVSIKNENAFNSQRNPFDFTEIILFQLNG